MTRPAPVRSPRRIRAFALVALASALLSSASCTKKDEPTYGDNLARAVRESKALGARGDMQAIANGITAYASNESGIPDASDIDGLAALIAPRYIASVKREDPWGTPFKYAQDGSSWSLSAAGADRTWGTADDMEMVDGQITKMPAGYTRFGP